MTPGMIDLRSEASAPLTSAVRAAMAEASAGVDSYDEDESVHALENFAAELFGVRQALFVPTGRLANVIAVALHCPPDGEVLLDAWSHLLRAEYGSVSGLLGRQTRTYASRGGLVDADGVLSLVRTTHSTRPTCLVGVEDPHNDANGIHQDVAVLTRLSASLRAQQVAMFGDGARIWYAAAETGIPFSTYGRLYDCLTISMVKGPMAPVGAICLFREDRRAEAIELRRGLGGGWARPGPMARAAEVALRDRLGLFGDDCQQARILAGLLAERLDEDLFMQATNTVSVRVADSAEFFDRCAELGVLLFRKSPTVVRAVLHPGISDDDTETAAAVIVKVINAMGRGQEVPQWK